ncbi:hypothetical protein BDL97_17G035800 [Sphagnum fallax]|nr:hypothetical protein BDL97_17G035800 [Sphagnum fallax]KAH8935576.1 hypothetical protein BDL97_17G035800 [Sphagnum fallax]
MEEQERIRMGKQQEKMEEEKEKEKEEGDDAPKMGFAKWVAARRKFAIDSPFFCAGNMERELLAKQFKGTYEILRWNGGALCISPKGKLPTWVGMQNFRDISVHYRLSWHLMHNSHFCWDLTCNALLAPL